MKVTSDADIDLVCDQYKYVKLRIKKESLPIWCLRGFEMCDKHSHTQDPN